MFLTAATPLLAALAIARTVRFQDVRSNVVAVVFFFLLNTAGEVLYIPLPKGGGVSVGLAVNLASIAILGPGTAALVSGLGLVTAIFIVSRNVGLRRYAFNFGQTALSSFGAGWVYVATGGRLGAGSLAHVGLSLVAASATFFAINVALVGLFLASESHQPFRAFWPDMKYNLVSYFGLVPLGLLVALIFRSYGVSGSLLFLVPLLLARYSFLQYLNTRNASVTVTQALAAALEAKDAYTRGHSDRVAAYSVELAREMGLPEEDVDAIRYAAEMHDIGKIGISENLLNKPGALTEAELVEIRRHALIGADMIHKIDFLKGVAGIIRYHHEWFGGSGGYPCERTGKAIPLGARILMVCDSYDAMTSDRPYRRSLERTEAIRRLNEGVGSQFDPDVVKAFLRVLERESKIRPGG